MIDQSGDSDSACLGEGGELERDLVESIPLGMLAIDRKGQVIFVNRVFFQMTGVGAAATVGIGVDKLLGRHPGLGIISQALLAALTAEPSCRRFSSPEADWYCSVHPLNSGKGALALFWDAGHDRELEQAVIKAERLAIMGQLSAGVMHEIRNPLAALRLFLQLLQRDLTATKRSEDLKLMLDAVDRINRIISDYLKLARPVLPRRQLCRLEQVVSKVLQLLEGEFRRQEVEVRVSVDSGLPACYIDETQIHQVVLNILNNALQVMPDGGEIIIGINHLRSESKLELICEDSGPGIPELLLAKVCEPFFTTKESGTGLGLYLCREIVTNHGGELEIGNSGRGCRVRIILPVFVSR